MKLSNEIRRIIAQRCEFDLEIIKSQGTTIITESVIKDVLNKAKVLIPGADEEDLNLIFKQLEARHQVHHSQGIAIYDNYDHINWYSERKEKEEFFWDRYRQHLIEEEHLDINSVNKLGEDTLINLMNSIADPSIPDNQKNLVRGLVIGDVQSGKTSTYAGLICKAADAGYKVVILLTGVTETLRQQTQERMEEGIIGFTTRKNKGTKVELITPVGVGLKDQSKRATAFTSYENDFKGGVSSITTSLQEYKSLVMFIVKKNTAVLNKLFRWLKAYNTTENDPFIHLPMLLIDDEADNASINTKKDKFDPTATNKVIREICNIFINTTYVGFTATPFANVFIDPNTPEQMKNADLFPKDFIYVLPTPSTYIGAKKIFYEDSEYHSSLKYITDVQEPDYDELESADEKHMLTRPFFHGHKKEWEGELPGSLTDAIYCFFLSNVARDLRGDNEEPRTMMINMSRFVKVQNYIKRHVEQIYKDFFDTIKFEFSDNRDENLDHPLFIKLKNLWVKNYNTDIEINDLLEKTNLIKAIEKMQIIVVNSGRNSSKLDYKKNKSLRAIAVGGLALSRGLTLKGLMTSYFYRNTATFDVLMQMGRWFGYRFNYADLCKIWTSELSADWYKIISDATEELKDDLKKLFNDKLTPSEFGIKVRDESDELQITALNKMRNSFDQDIYISLWGSISETPYLSLNSDNNHINYDAVKQLISTLHKNNLHFLKHKGGKIPFVSHVPKGIVSDFLREIKINIKNIKFDPSQIEEIINSDNSSKMQFWDICFINGDSNQTIELSTDVEVQLLHRKIIKGNGCFSFAGRGTLGGTSDGKIGLSDDQINRVLKALEKDKKGVKNKAWFEYCEDRSPILFIYLIKPKELTEDQKEDEQLTRYITSLGNTPVVAFAMGFPANNSSSASATHYKVNSTWVKLNYEDVEEE